MNSGKISVRRASVLLASMLVGSSLFGADDPATTAASSNSTSTAVAAQSQDAEIAQLKAALAEQQKQLQSLQQALQNQQQLIEKVSGAPVTAQRPNLGNVASLTPVLPAPAPMPVALATPAPRPQGATGGSGNPCEAGPDNAVPPYMRLGSVCIVPVGFMDFTPFWRDKNAGSSMGSNFGSVPYNNTVNGNLSETKFSVQNSRLGLRVDGDWKGAHFIGYNEFDFNGTGGATNYGVSNGAIVPRLRLFWVDVRKDKIEFLAGQSWSMMVPNRKGISALPGDLMYSQVIDINYVAGLTWTRQPGIRVLFHPNKQWTFGFSVEQADQYAGGSAGGSSITLPAAYTALTSTQLDFGAGLGATPPGSYLATPTVTPDFIAKIAWDPSSRFHMDIAGIESNFKITNTGAPFTQHPTTIGAGVELGLNLEVFKNFRLISTDYWSDGDGRYMFGQAPDVIVRADGSLSAVHSAGMIQGFEATMKNTLLYAYASGIYVARDVAVDANGTSLVGYGYNAAGSYPGQNRLIKELTFGFNQTIWKNAKYGAINFMGQYEWLQRAPWFVGAATVAGGDPRQTHDSTIYFNVRYTLPGSMPNF